MYHTLELLKTQNTEKYNCETNKYNGVPKLWKGHKKSTNLFSHCLAGFDSPQWPYDSEYPQCLKIDVDCNDFNNSSKNKTHQNSLPR